MHYRRWQVHGTTSHAPRACENCKQEFVPYRSDARFCSDLCSHLARGTISYGPKGYVITCEVCEKRRAVAPSGTPRKACHRCESARRRQRGRAWREANPEKRREQERQRRVRETEEQREAKRKWLREHMRQKRASQPRFCTDCGTELSEWNRRRCEACYQRQRPLPELSTVTWGRARRVVFPPSKRVFIAGNCAHCDTPFIATGKQDRFCSKLCNKRWWRAQRRTARREAEHNVRVMVFVADGWICRLCGTPTADEVIPHPKAPTVDHIVPIARGGPDIIENLQTAHFICNSEKRDMTMDEWEAHVGWTRTCA